MTGKARARVDREVERQLERGDRDQCAVQVVVGLHPPDPEGEPRFDREWAEKVAKCVIDRVGAEIGQNVEDYNVFGSLGAFVVQASSEFVRRLIEQDEVASVVSNRPGGQAEGDSRRSSGRHK